MILKTIASHRTRLIRSSPLQWFAIVGESQPIHQNYRRELEQFMEHPPMLSLSLVIIISILRVVEHSAS